MLAAAPASSPPCPCSQPGERLGYADCCGRYHAGPLHLRAPTAEALMRSRYSAFVRDELDYLLATWHPSTRPAALEANPPGLRWLGLQLLPRPPRRVDSIDADHDRVEFIARSKLGGRAQRLHELSRFVREADRWYYLAGELG